MSGHTSMSPSRYVSATPPFAPTTTADVPPLQRIIDSVPMTIDLQFLYAFCESLQDCAFEKLGLGAPDAKSKCDFYLSEDPNVAARREALNAKKARLVKVQRAISKFGL